MILYLQSKIAEIPAVQRQLIGDSRSETAGLCPKKSSSHQLQKKGINFKPSVKSKKISQALHGMKLYVVNELTVENNISFYGLKGKYPIHFCSNTSFIPSSIINFGIWRFLRKGLEGSYYLFKRESLLWYIIRLH